MSALADAEEILVIERRRVIDEREAFFAFRRRIQEAPTAAQTALTSPPLPQRGVTAASTERVREAYVRTVMSLPHYEEAYGDGLRESLAGEFGVEVAAAICDDRSLSPALQTVLIGGAESAANDRAAFLELLDAETTSLGALADGIDSVLDQLEALDDRPLTERSHRDLGDLYDAVRELEVELDRLAERRQATVAAHRRTVGGRLPVLEYLYCDLDVDFPGLTAVARAGAILRTARRRVERHLVRSL